MKTTTVTVSSASINGVRKVLRVLNLEVVSTRPANPGNGVGYTDITFEDPR